MSARHRADLAHDPRNPEVPLDVDDGLKTASVANLDALQTVSNDRLGRSLGSIRGARREELRGALLFALSLDE